MLCSALRAAFGGCALHAPAGAVVRDDMVYKGLACYIHQQGEKTTMKNTIFTGMATAIVTPMTETGIDYEALGLSLIHI